MTDHSSQKISPESLVDEFKRQGHFDQIRKQLFLEFFQSERQRQFRDHIEAHLSLHIDHEADRLARRDARLRHSDLMHELDQHPLLDELVRELDEGPAPLLAPEGSVTKQITGQLEAMVRENSTA